MGMVNLQETQAGDQARDAALARAEAHGISFEWEEDDEPWDPGETGIEPHQAYGCVLRDRHGDVRESLWGISFGPGNGPYLYDLTTNATEVVCYRGRYLHPYALTVQAELAQEYFAKRDAERELAGPDPFGLALVLNPQFTQCPTCETVTPIVYGPIGGACDDGCETPLVAYTPPDDAAMRAAAKAEYHAEGEVEVDDRAVVSRGEEAGAYVQAWVWVSFIDAEVTHGEN
jgi:hypothetical protein